MKIDQTGNVKDLYSASGKSSKRPDPAVSDSTVQADNVQINPLASQISAASQALGSEPSFDVNKVAAIKDAIASGSFQINPQNIADGLISSARQLLSN